MAMLAMAFPIPAGKTEQWKKFISELTGARKAEFAASRRSLGVRERTFLQHTPQGDLVLVTLEGDQTQLKLTKFSAQDVQGGSLSASGSIDLAALPAPLLDLKATLSNLRVLDCPRG